MIGSGKLNAFVELGDRIKALGENERKALASKAYQKNRWFDFPNVDFALNQVSSMLSRQELESWLSRYTETALESKKVGLIMAGNIPMVGFADALAVLLSGHRLHAKMSQDDQTLMLFLFETLLEIDPTLASQITLIDKLNEVDAVIATGSDNTAKHFEYYFKNKPHIIRRNRVSVAILNGEETPDELAALGTDIFQYYGLGCRNISKIFIPAEYDLATFFEAIEPWRPVIDHHKFNNNYEYNRAIYLLKSVTHLDNGFLILTETTDLVSPIAIVLYERYSDVQQLQDSLEAQKEKIQCIVASGSFWPGAVPFGQAQMPHLWNYADGVDTMKFLLSV